MHFISVPGPHIGISKNDVKKYVVPYLKDQVSTEDSTNKVSFSMVQGVNQSNTMEME